MRISDWSSDVCSSDLVGDRGRSRDVVEHRSFRGRHLRAVAECDAFGSCAGTWQASHRRLSRRWRRPARRGTDLQSMARFCRIGHWNCWIMRGDRHFLEHPDRVLPRIGEGCRSEEHTSELQSLMRISYAVFCLKKKKTKNI